MAKFTQEFKVQSVEKALSKRTEQTALSRPLPLTAIGSSACTIEAL